MAIELWSDEGDDPGEKIADLGTIDDVSAVPTSDTVFPFEADVKGLNPEGRYWVVIQFEGITSSLNENNTIGWPFSFSEDGANTTENIHATRAQDNGRWTDMSTVWTFLGPTLIHQMRVQTETASPSKPLELPNENPLSFTIEADTTIMPEFVVIQPHALTIISSEGGTVNANPDLPSYPPGTEVILTATADPGFRLAGWEGDTSEEGNPASITLTMDRDKSVAAIFEAQVVASPEISEIRFDAASQRLNLRWSSEEGIAYGVETSTDLATWESLITEVGTGGEVLTGLALPEDDRQRYYRLRPNP